MDITNAKKKKLTHDVINKEMAEIEDEVERLEYRLENDEDCWDGPFTRDPQYAPGLSLEGEEVEDRIADLKARYAELEAMPCDDGCCDGYKEPQSLTASAAAQSVALKAALIAASMFLFGASFGYYVAVLEWSAYVRELTR